MGKKLATCRVSAALLFRLRWRVILLISTRARVPSKHDDPAYQDAFLRDLFENHRHPQDGGNSWQINNNSPTASPGKELA